MQIPMTPIQAASVSAIPQQSLRDTRASSTTAATEPNTLEIQLDEKLAKSTETGDRDAQEQYQRPPSANRRDNPKSENAAKSDPLPDSIWTLSVADEQPPSDLDIRG